MRRTILRGSIFFATAALLMLSVAAAFAGQGIDDQAGAAYVLTNRDTNNSIAVFQRSANGTLTAAGEVLTGGKGSGGGPDALASQGSLRVSDSGDLLFAVNAGSNDVSVFRVAEKGLQLLQTVASGGVQPVSVGVHRDLVYVLNAGGTPNIAGFRIGQDRKLHAIANSTRDLAGGPSAAPAQVEFTLDGRLLLVTEKGTNSIDIFPVGDDGRTTDQKTQTSNGPVPFGFSFVKGATVLVSEAGSSSVSSYRVVDPDALETISDAVPDTQKAACWVAVTNSGRFAFITNTASGTVSSYRISPRGELTLVSAVAATTGPTGAVDLAFSRDSRFLYVVNAALGTVTAFAVTEGSLTQIGSAGGLPTSVQGIVAR